VRKQPSEQVPASRHPFTGELAELTIFRSALTKQQNQSLGG